MDKAKIYEQVLKRIAPTEKEYEEEMKLAEGLVEKIKAFEGKHVDVILAGSLSRNTHLKGDRDIDIFVMFPEKMPREGFVKEGLRIGKKVLKGYKWEEAYSEHPYLRANVKGYDVEIVPSYKITRTEDLKSAVDRTPFHLKYLEGKFDGKGRNEVRLLRQFLKGVRCYGADLKASSIPGYVVELLIVKYGSFEKALKAMAKWRIGEVLDVGKHYNSPSGPRNRFKHHFIVVDPIDKNRNVAAALSLTQYERCIAAARAFLKKPSIDFFFGRKKKLWSSAKVRQMFRQKELVAVKMKYPKGSLADIVWGQLRRLGKKAARQLEVNEFRVVRHDVWTDEKSEMVIVLELEELELPEAMKRVGPKVSDEKNQKRFLEAHKKVISGPRVEKGRWVIEIKRPYTRAEKFLGDHFRKSAKAEKPNIRKAMSKGIKVMSERDILKLYKKDEEFREFLTFYLKGKEEFLDY